MSALELRKLLLHVATCECQEGKDMEEGDRDTLAHGEEIIL